MDMIHPPCYQGWFCRWYRLQPRVPGALEGKKKIAGLSRFLRGDDRERIPHVPELVLSQQGSIL